MPDKFLNKYRIRSARLSTWDYSSNAAYFLTICTANRKNYFGEVIEAKMRLSAIGEFANQCWLNIPDHFPYFYLDEFIVMPNHIHGMVLIEQPYAENNKDFNTVDVPRGQSPRQSDIKQETKRKHPRFRNQGKKTISAMVGSFKSAVTKYCNENKLLFGWQTRFHDHIIRDTNEFYSIRHYIINNPAFWENDEFHSITT